MRERRILVVDDELATREAVAEILGDEGYEVVLAADGLAALEQASACVPELVLTDLWMPRLDGLRLLERLRALHSGLPVIIITAHSSADAERSAHRFGATGFLRKPLDVDDLLRRIRSCLV